MRTFLAGIVLAASLVGAAAARAGAEEQLPYGHTLYRIIKAIAGDRLTVQQRDGRIGTVDIHAARAAGRTGVLYPGRAVALHGDYDALRVFHVVSIGGAAGIRYSRGAWPQDQ